MATSADWKSHIHCQLHRRNRKQIDPFISLIQTNNRLQEITSQLHLKNVHLQVEVERLKEENNHQIRGDGLGGNNASTHALEQKLFKLQEELTEMHKKRGENSQQIIDLNALLQEKEKEIQHKDAMISDTVTTNIALKQAKKNLEMTIAELEATNQMLKDEHQALQMAFTALEEKYQKAMEDNNDLVQRWMEQKAKDADKMNAENADFIKARQQRLARDLEEAAKEQVTVDTNKGPLEVYIPVCVYASVPSRAQNVFDAHEGEVYSVQWSCSGGYFATGGADRKIKLWEGHGGLCESKGTLVGSNAGITSLDFSQDDLMIVGASNDFASRVWTINDQRLRHTLTGHSGKVMSAKFLTESKIVSGSHDRTLKVWDLNSKACVKTIFAGSSCNDLVSSHGTSIISGHFDKRVRFWDIRTSGDSSINEILLTGRLTSLCLSTDKSQLLCCTRDDCLKILDLRMNQVSCTLVSDGFKVGWDSARAVFSPDVEYVAAGSSDGNLYVWNIAKNKVEKVLKEHSHAVLACSWNPAGTSIVSCEKGRKVVLWSDY
ncbi:unnamed protein product [Candidula unifasciata]|uniref:Autophagy-related protein 16 domain-containing protein n=1 Tax=Candidula unifasciata TaxID=100452 RepID=A0A8S4A6B4_9EUPU|nr:unnamed protein product [Candidula unifasciata]